MAQTVILCIIAIMLYCVIDRKQTNKKAADKKTLERLDTLEETVKRQDALIGDLAGHMDDMAEHIRVIAEDVVGFVPVAGQNQI